MQKGGGEAEAFAARRNKRRRFAKSGSPGFLLVHHFHGDTSKFSKLPGGVTAQRLPPNPSLDSGQQRRSEPVVKERMLLAVSHGRPRNDCRTTTVVFQNGIANGDALITNVGPRVVAGA